MASVVLLSQLIAVVSAPILTPLVTKTIHVSPLSPWSIVWLVSFGIIALLVVPLVKEGVEKARKALDPVKRSVADDETRFLQLKAVCTFYHAGNSYDASIAKAQKQMPANQKWNVSTGTLSAVVSDFRTEHGKEPRSAGIETFLNSLQKKTMGRGDGLSEQQYVRARDLFNQKSKNWKAIPNWNDWNEMLCVVKEKEKGFQFSFEFLLTSAFKCKIRPIKCSGANAARVLAVGDYRNHIGCGATWIACTRFHGVARECIYSLDDTSLLLEPKFGRELQGLATEEQVAAARKSNIGLSVMASEKDFKTNCKVLKVLVLTSGGGACPMKVIKIRDSKITKEALVRISETDTTEIWIHWIPDDAEDTAETHSQKNVRYASKIFKACVLRAIKKDMARLVKGPTAISKFGDDGAELDNSQPLSQNTRSGRAAQRAAKFGRAILTFDGDWPQLQAIIDSRNADGECFAPLAAEFSAANIELFKWAGGCSGIQQPLDRGRSFFCLKSALKGGQRSKFKYKNVSEMSVLPDYCTAEFEEDCKKIFGNVSRKGNADWNTFWKFIVNFEDLSAYAFRKELIVQSFSITGLAPFSMKMILKSYCFYDSLLKYEPTAMAMIEEALPELVEEASRTGYVLDESIDRLLWPLFCAVADEKYMKKKTPDMPINHRRCIWLSNAAWLSSEYARIKTAEAKKVADEAAKILKKEGVAKRKREAAERAVANASKRNKPFYAETWEPDRAWPAKGEVYVPCLYDLGDSELICACMLRSKAAHLKSGEHTAWLATIRPLEERKRAAPPDANANASLQQESSSSDSDSDGSDDSAAPLPVAHGSAAVIAALGQQEEQEDVDGIYAHRFDAHAAVFEAAAADDVEKGHVSDDSQHDDDN